MLSWLAGRRSPSGDHLLTDDPLAAISAPADKQQTVYAVSRVNPVFKDEAWNSIGRPTDDDRSEWQRSAADGRTYWHEPAPDSLEPAVDCPPDSLEPTAASPVAARRFVEFRGAPLPVYPDVHRAAEVRRSAGPGRVPELHWGAPLVSGRPATLPRPVWPQPPSGPARPRSTDGGYMNVTRQIGATWPPNRQHAGDVRLGVDGRATFPPGRGVFPGRLPSIADEEEAGAEQRSWQPAADGQPDSIVTDSLLLLTSPQPTPTGSLRADTREGASQAGSTEKADSFSWEGAAPRAEPPRALPPPGPATVNSFSWERTLEPLLQVLWAGEQLPVVLHDGGRQEDPEAAAGRQDPDPAGPQPWLGSEPGGVALTGGFPAPPSRAGSERSQVYSVPVAPQMGDGLEEELYAWPVSPPVAVPAALLGRPPPRCESPPAYLNQLLPSDASDSGRSRRLGSDASQHSRVRRLPSDAASDASRGSRGSSGSGGSRGSRSRLLPSDGSEGGSERRVTFSADTVDNEPGPARPRPRRPLERRPRPGTTRRAGKHKHRGFYASNVLSRLTGANNKAGQNKDLEFRNFTVDVGRAAAMRRQAARRWRSRHLCSAITAVLVLILLIAAGVLIAWLWNTEERLFQV